MAALDFPASPTVGQLYTANGITYRWDGVSWDTYNPTDVSYVTGILPLVNTPATTIGSNLFTLVNPSAITFPRFNADNTVSALDAATFRTAIGAGTGNGTVTSVSGTGTVNGITLTGTVTSTGNLTLGGTLGSITNTQLVNSSITINGTAIALGASGTITANTTNALSAGTGLSFTTGTTFDGSAARTLNLANTTVVAGSYGSASNTLTATVDAQGRLTALSAVAIAIANTQVSGLGTMSTQNASAVAITGGTINGTVIGGTTAAAGTFTTVTATTYSGINGGTF